MQISSATHTDDQNAAIWDKITQIRELNRRGRHSYGIAQDIAIYEQTVAAKRDLTNLLTSQGLRPVS